MKISWLNGSWIKLPFKQKLFASLGLYRYRLLPILLMSILSGVNMFRSLVVVDPVWEIFNYFIRKKFPIFPKNVQFSRQIFPTTFSKTSIYTYILAKVFLFFWKIITFQLTFSPKYYIVFSQTRLRPPVTLTTPQPKIWEVATPKPPGLMPLPILPIFLLTVDQNFQGSNPHGGNIFVASFCIEHPFKFANTRLLLSCMFLKQWLHMIL